MIEGNSPTPGEPTEDNRHDIFQRGDDRKDLMSSVQSGASNRAEDSATAEDLPVTKEDLMVITRDLSAVQHRMEQIEEDYYRMVPVPTPTPTDGLTEIKVKLTQLINYINIGVRR